MKIQNLILSVFFLLMGSTTISAQSKKGGLPVIDFSKSYPEKKIILQDIADIEYVPLETTDDILLGDKATLSYISDKYIFFYDPDRGDMFVFNRTGKIYAKFNHKGSSSMEYSWIFKGGVVFDEKNEEIFVCSTSIQVYSLKGEYKRTLKINMVTNNTEAYNLDDEALFVYDNEILNLTSKARIKEKPYSLISKKDGSVISVLDILLPERYSTHIMTVKGNIYNVTTQYFKHSMQYGRDFMIADISSDTLYNLTPKRQLIPVLTRTPSVHASEPRKVWTTFITTDNFMIIGLVTLDFESKSGGIPNYMYELKTGEISRIRISDAEFNMYGWSQGDYVSAPKNMTANKIQPTDIIESYKKKPLKGDIEKLAKTLSEDDNPVVRIIKFR